MTDNNNIIHGMWIGNELSCLELLTLRSFTNFGHDFHLWVYDDISTPLPVGVSLRDASQIIPRDKVFKKLDYCRETGVGKGSYSAPFSDLFRYKLLYELGGTWVDMDVTCLRPFDFTEEYVLRPHRVGVAGSIMKCPRGSQLMRDSYEETAATVNEQSEWLAPTRILSKNVQRLELDGFIRPNLSNVDSWLHVIRPFIEQYTPIPDEWYAIHWINEFWRTLEIDNGYYRGRKVIDYIPDKDRPAPRSTLYELYRKHRVIDPWQEVEPSPNGAQHQAAIDGSAARKSAVAIEAGPKQPAHFNVLVPSMVRGGAERSVLETRAALRKLGGVTQTLYLLNRSQLQYPVESADNAPVMVVDHDADERTRGMRSVALNVLQSPVPVIYTHLLRAEYLRHLWKMGVTTIPVVQNSRPSWLDPPTAYNHPCVPFVVAVADAVADQLRESGCEKPVITIRHELQRWFRPEQLASDRRAIRDRHGIRDDTLLIGMVGQFKSQKAYTRAVRVLHAVRQSYPAKLLILGGWDHEYGSGRAAYEAACRLALELGVIADMITPGDVHPVEPYFAAFDVFMNTSVYEGLSVALLEAIQTGCPIVAADAGGTREVLPPTAVLVEDPSDIAAYAAGIRRVANERERVLPPPAPEDAVVARLWSLLAKHGVASSVAPRGAAAGTLFVTDSLPIGGAQRSLLNLLCRMPASRKTFLLVLDGSFATSYKEALAQAQVPVLTAAGLSASLDLTERVLQCVDRFNFRNICFWNVNPEVKLALAKILAVRKVRLIDVSPGPMLLDELAAAAPFQQRIALKAEQYLRRLDCFVAKYADGVPTALNDERRLAVIRNGVPLPPRFIALPPASSMLPQRFDANFAIGTCCRIVPDKRVEFLLEMMKILSVRKPAASLTVVGGPDKRTHSYLRGLMEMARDAGLENIIFAGQHEDVNPFLAQFRVFVMVSERQGCPNASLEAMAMKLPVVANRSGGVAEQIQDGINGFLISDPAEMAARVELLLTNDEMRRNFGAAGYQIARERFSMDEMVNSYCRVLGD